MKSASEKCVVCGAQGASCVWNAIAVLRCPDCGLAWRAVFDVHIDYYAALHGGEVGVGEEKAATRLRNAEDRLVSLKEFLPRSGICDIGCGDGSFLSVLRDKGYRECWGIEPSAYACDLTSAKKLDVILGDISYLPQVKQEKTLRACTLFHVIEHVPDPLDTLQTLNDALPPGGILVIETPDADAALQRVTGHNNALIYREHLFYWTEESIRRVLERKGFKILKVSRRSFDWQHASLSASIMRLGLFRWSSTPDLSGDRGCMSLGMSSQQPVPSNEQLPFTGSFVRILARTLLAHVVHLLRRDDYLLVVAGRR